jgi:NDP-sugar pyrophosphorylase family protein
MKRKAMILAAGLGTRLGELTRHRPKALVEVHGRPLLEIQLNKLLREGFDEVVVNVHHHAGMIRAWLQEHEPEGMKVRISEEKERPLETGGGVRYARELLVDADNFLILNVDILTDLDTGGFLDDHQASGSLVTLAVSRRSTNRYLLADGELYLCGWENTATGEKIMVKEPSGELTQWGYSGIAALSRKALFLLPEEEIFSLTPFFLDLAREHPVRVAAPPMSYWYDVGKPGIIEQVEKEGRTMNDE